MSRYSEFVTTFPAAAGKFARKAANGIRRSIRQLRSVPLLEDEVETATAEVLITRNNFFRGNALNGQSEPVTKRN